MGWVPHPAGGQHLPGVFGMEIIVTPLPTTGAWSATVRALEHDYCAVRDSEQAARDWALTRALAVYPAVVDLAYRRALEDDPGDMAECRRSEHDLLAFALTQP